MDTELKPADTWPDEAPVPVVGGDLIALPETDPSVEPVADAPTGEAPQESDGPDLAEIDYGQVAWYGAEDLFVFDAGLATTPEDAAPMAIMVVDGPVLFAPDSTGSPPDEDGGSPPAAEGTDDAPDDDKPVIDVSDQGEVAGEAPTGTEVGLVDGEFFAPLAPIDPIPPIEPPFICILIIDPVERELPLPVICPAPVEEAGQLYYGDAEATCALTDAAIPVALAL